MSSCRHSQGLQLVMDASHAAGLVCSVLLLNEAALCKKKDGTTEVHTARPCTPFIWPVVHAAASDPGPFLGLNGLFAAPPVPIVSSALPAASTEVTNNFHTRSIPLQRWDGVASSVQVDCVHLNMRNN